jgi:outer membrane protein
MFKTSAAGRTLVIALSSLACANGAQAEALFPTLSDERFRWGIGLGLLSEDEGYRDIGRKTETVPVLYIETQRLRLFGPQAEYRVLGNRDSALQLRADYRFDGFEAKDGAVFAGMTERKGSIYLGFAGHHRAPWGELSFDLVKATTASRGIRGGLTYARPLRSGPWTVVPKIGVEFFDRKFVGYYYGVRAEEVTPSRPAYSGESSVNLDLGIDVHYQMGASHTLLSSLKYRHFGSAIQDSPLIDRNGSPRLNVGYLLRF